MKRRRKTKPPAWQYHPTPVLRDVAPGRVPVALHDEDGSLWHVADITADAVSGVEMIAKGKGLSFAQTFVGILAERMGMPWESPM